MQLKRQLKFWICFLQNLHLKDAKNVFFFNTIAASACILLFSFGLYTTFNLKTEYSLKQFYPQNHPLLNQENRLRSLFQFDKNLSIFLVLKSADSSSWLEQKNYSVLKQIHDSFQTSADFKSVVSLASIQGASNSSQEISVGHIFDNPSFEARRKLAETHPFVKPHLLDKNESATLLILNLKSATPLEIFEYTHNLKSYFAKNYPALNIEFGGLPVVQADLSVLLKKELLRSIGFGLILFMLGLLLVYKKSLSIIPVVMTLTFVNIVVLGSLATLGISLNVLLTTLPILISLAVISLVIHIQSHFLKSKNLWATYRSLFWENLLAVLTTGLGFLLLRTSSSALIQNYGLIVAGSSLAVWFLVHLISVPLFYFFPAPDFREWIHKPAYWSLWTLKNPKAILIPSLFVFGFGFYSVTKINWNSKILDDLPEGEQTRMTTEFIDRSFGGTLEANFVISTKSSWQQTGALKKLDSALTKIKGLSTVGSAITVTDFYKSIAANNSQRLPASKGELAEQNFMFSLSSTNPIEKYLSQDNKNVLVQVRYKDLPSDKIQFAKSSIMTTLRNSFPDSKISSFGFGTQYHTINQEISKDLVFGFWQALLIIGLLLAFVFKSWRWALLACLPNLLPPLVLLICLNLNQVSLKPSVAIIFSIAIGLAFTNTVYILGRILKLQKASDYKNYFPIKKALIEESNPCLLATVLVILGFVVFLFSYFGMNRMFGQYMIVSVVAALFGDLIFLPSFLFQFKKYFMSTAILFLVFFGGQATASANEAQDLLKKSQALISSKDDTALVSMIIIESDGSKKERQLTIKRKFANKKNQVLVKIQKPADQKGAGLLSVIDSGSEQQWVYLPSSKQVRRFVSTNKQEGVLGSELSPQDLDLTTVKSSKVELIKKAKVGAFDVSLVEVKSESNQTRYTKAIIWIDQKQLLPLRIEYFGAKPAALKRIDFQNYRSYGGIFRAQKILIKNLENKRGTDLLLSNIKVNSGLTDNDFTQRVLSKD